jgi:hypothetical protein
MLSHIKRLSIFIKFIVQSIAADSHRELTQIALTSPLNHVILRMQVVSASPWHL